MFQPSMTFCLLKVALPSDHRFVDQAGGLGRRGECGRQGGRIHIRVVVRCLPRVPLCSSFLLFFLAFTVCTFLHPSTGRTHFFIPPAAQCWPLDFPLGSGVTSVFSVFGVWSRFHWRRWQIKGRCTTAFGLRWLRKLTRRCLMCIYTGVFIFVRFIRN
uniref:Uncharacterized protein TCIL3000_7_3310 n=1 Tax=Trypanosoma congolense (strain IL3000) TaxID=1068625 RepID=G0UQ56_TRYCI|nr:unnamed protein product [Trypanosoma congolense IL3000]